MSIKIKYLKIATKEVENCKECPHFEFWENSEYEYVCEVELYEHYYETQNIDELIKECPFKEVE